MRLLLLTGKRFIEITLGFIDVIKTPTIRLHVCCCYIIALSREPNLEIFSEQPNLGLHLFVLDENINVYPYKQTKFAFESIMGKT